MDADQDGIDDVILASTGQTIIFRGRGDGSFYPFFVVPHEGLNGTYPYVLDVTRDGVDDILLMHEAGAALLVGYGNGAFEFTGDLVRDEAYLTTIATYGDYNGDGQMDLYIGRMNVVGQDDLSFGSQGDCLTPEELDGVINRATPAMDVMLFTDGDGWKNGLTESGLTRGLYTQAVTSADINLDGTLDILVGTEGMRPDFTYIGDGLGAFSDVSETSSMTLNTSAMGFDVVDIDFDGDLDIYVTDEDTMGGDKLYIQTEPGLYESQTETRGLESTKQYSGWGLGFHDFDHDADYDLFVANGLALGDCPGGEQENLLFTGDENGYFARVDGGPTSGLSVVYNSRAAVFSDIDQDGDLDILVSNVGDPPTLLRNDMPNQGRWLQIRLTHPTLSPVVGASVTLTANGRTHRRAVHGTPSYGGSSTQWIHFGLGQALEAENVVIRWPDGTKKSLGSVAANQRINVNYNSTR
jgi:hypothetical protein